MIIISTTNKQASKETATLATLIKSNMLICALILVQVTIYRRLLIGQDGHLDQSEAYDIS